MVRIVTYVTMSIGLALKLISVGSTWTILPILRGYLALEEVKLLILFRLIILSLKYGTAKNIRKKKGSIKLMGKMEIQRLEMIGLMNSIKGYCF